MYESVAKLPCGEVTVAKLPCGEVTGNLRDTRQLETVAVFPLGFGLVRIRPNDKFVEIFVQRFHYFEDPFYKFFAVNLLFQGTSYSLALKYSSFMFKFFSFASYNINFWFKISKICPKLSHFPQNSHSRAVVLNFFTCWHPFLHHQPILVSPFKIEKN